MAKGALKSVLRRRWVRSALAALAVLVAMAVVVDVFYMRLAPPPQHQARSGGSAATPRPNAPAAQTTANPGGATSNPGAATNPQPVAQRLVPGMLVIPKINVRATVEQVTVDSNNDMAAPSKPSDVGWYSPGVAPGQSGDAVIDGHLDWYGVPKAVFYYLNQLKVGDQVEIISQSGRQLNFKVTDSTYVSRTAHPAGLFQASGAPRITLITCSGDWDPNAGQYSQRLLVDAAFAGASNH